jgi:hypothetical protein
MEKRKDRRGLFMAFGASALLLVGALVIASVISPGAISVFGGSNSNTAYLTVNVLEGYTETPIANASVAVVETGKVYQTDENGMTDKIDVPVIRDARYDSIIQKPWGEITLIIYKEGFVPYALFYLQVLGGQTREGVKILLFEEGQTESSEPFSIIEGPNRVWVDALVEMYRPKNP